VKKQLEAVDQAESPLALLALVGEATSKTAAKVHLLQKLS
jgi:hypothetical protein